MQAHSLMDGRGLDNMDKDMVVISRYRTGTFGRSDPGWLALETSDGLDVVSLLRI